MLWCLSLKNLHARAIASNVALAGVVPSSALPRNSAAEVTPRHAPFGRFSRPRSGLWRLEGERNATATTSTRE
jgi:hypothetical protein